MTKKSTRYNNIKHVFETGSKLQPMNTEMSYSAVNHLKVGGAYSASYWMTGQIWKQRLLCFFGS